jgi:hypothetical protein
MTQQKSLKPKKISFVFNILTQKVLLIVAACLVSGAVKASPSSHPPADTCQDRAPGTGQTERARMHDRLWLSAIPISADRVLAVENSDLILYDLNLCQTLLTVPGLLGSPGSSRLLVPGLESQTGSTTTVILAEAGRIARVEVPSDWLSGSPTPFDINQIQWRPLPKKARTNWTRAVLSDDQRVLSLLADHELWLVFDLERDQEIASVQGRAALGVNQLLAIQAAGQVVALSASAEALVVDRGAGPGSASVQRISLPSLKAGWAPNLVTPDASTRRLWYTGQDNQIYSINLGDAAPTERRETLRDELGAVVGEPGLNSISNQLSADGGWLLIQRLVQPPVSSSDPWLPRLRLFDMRQTVERSLSGFDWQRGRGAPGRITADGQSLVFLGAGDFVDGVDLFRNLFRIDLASMQVRSILLPADAIRILWMSPDGGQVLVASSASSKQLIDVRF